jgi:hypothetical protein
MFNSFPNAIRSSVLGKNVDANTLFKTRNWPDVARFRFGFSVDCG